MTKSKQPIHLLLRFSNSLLKDKDTIDEHNQVVRQSGAVWFGKMGSPVSHNHIDLIIQQIEAGTPTYVYLVKGNRRKSTTYRSRLLAVSATLPAGENQFVPPYYYEMDFTKYMKFWAKMAEITPISFDELSRMRVASSVLPIRETLIKSATGHFILVQNKDLL